MDKQRGSQLLPMMLVSACVCGHGREVAWRHPSSFKMNVLFCATALGKFCPVNFTT